jgi:hypothetical protein
VVLIRIARPNQACGCNPRRDGGRLLSVNFLLPGTRILRLNQPPYTPHGMEIAPMSFTLAEVV